MNSHYHKLVQLSGVACIAAILMIGACSGDTNSSPVVNDLRKELSSGLGILIGEDVIVLMSSEDGQHALSTIANETDTLYYDGDLRFIQLVGGETPDGTPFRLLGLIPGGLELGYEKTIRLKNFQKDHKFKVKYFGDYVVFSVMKAPGIEGHTFAFDWAPKTLPPTGWVDLETGERDIHP